MGYKQVVLVKTAKVSLKNNSLCIVKDNDNPQEIVLPLEDISSILFEDIRTVITARFISECSKYGIALYFCDETYMPNTQVLPLNTHYSQLEVYNKQISLPTNVTNKLWQDIVKRKILNQAYVVKETSNDERVYEMLLSFSKSVLDNDSSNREGIASKVYFNSIYGTDFIRFQDNNISNALNYGYTIFHGELSRLLVVYGFNTYIGIWHNSNKNAYNLASDFIEVFRPIVDRYCYWNCEHLDKPLSLQNRKDLINLLNEKVIIGNLKCKVSYAMELVVKSYLKVLNTRLVTDLVLPNMIGDSIENNEEE